MGWWWWGALLMFRCPKEHDLHLPHEIAPDGSASPSLLCPVEACGFHDMVRLEGWNGGQRHKTARDDVIAQRMRELDLPLAAPQEPQRG